VGQKIGGQASENQKFGPCMKQLDASEGQDRSPY
jgi:hypothetical protein